MSQGVDTLRPQKGTQLSRLVHNLSSDKVMGYLLIFPLVAWVGIVIIYPLISAIRLSFHDLRLVGAEGPFVGLKLYKYILLEDKEFWLAFKNSLIWTLGNSLFQGVLGLCAAVLLNQKFRGRYIARTWVIAPWIIPPIVMALMWRWILSGTFGVVNYVLTSLHIVAEPIVFLGSASNAMPTVILANTWRWFPFGAVLLLASMQTIPQEQYEAAAIDGASSLQAFKYITLPNLKPVMITMGLLGTFWSFSMFDVVWLLTQGGPGNATTTLPLLVYKRAFKVFRMGEASAISVIMLVFLLALAVLYLRLNSSQESR